MAIKIKKGSTPSQFQVNQAGRKRRSRTLSDSVCPVVVSIVAACATGTSIVEIEQICGEGFLIITPKNPDRQFPTRRSPSKSYANGNAKGRLATSLDAHADNRGPALCNGRQRFRDLIDCREANLVIVGQLRQL